MQRRKRRARELSGSPSPPPHERDVIALSDDDQEQGTADLTLHILDKAKKRGQERERAVALESEDDVRREKDGASGRMEADERAQSAVPPRDGSGVLAEAEPVLSAKAKKKLRRKEEKERKEKERKEKEGEKELEKGKERKVREKERKAKRKKEATAKVVNVDDTRAEPDKPAEAKLLDAEGSLAMRKLLRGPRYFDPPEELGETCYSCGQEGHRAADCTEQPRQKPCYVCGNFGHDGYDCLERTECYECGKSGHVARNCPSKQYQPYQPRRGTGLCLLCGRLGHDASTCSGEYDPDDSKQVHCYICKKLGHLCCIEVVDAAATPVSCYQCGDLGHTGLTCSRQNGDRGDNSSCYRCGQEGHFARECPRTSRDYNIKQRRHSWPAPWSADNGRYGDQEPPFTPACQIRPAPFKKRLEKAQASSGKKMDYESKKMDYESKKRKYDESEKGKKRKRKEGDSFEHPSDRYYSLDSRKNSGRR